MICGGDGFNDGGYLDVSGVLRGHYWVEARNAEGQCFILDITADQFGGPEMVCAPLGQGEALKYCKGNQKLVDMHVLEFEREISEGCNSVSL